MKKTREFIRENFSVAILLVVGLDKGEKLIKEMNDMYFTMLPSTSHKVMDYNMGYYECWDVIKGGLDYLINQLDVEFTDIQEIYYKDVIDYLKLHDQYEVNFNHCNVIDLKKRKIVGFLKDINFNLDSISIDEDFDEKGNLRVITKNLNGDDYFLYIDEIGYYVIKVHEDLDDEFIIRDAKTQKVNQYTGYLTDYTYDKDDLPF
ncbi:hypothetical protein RJG79_08560 [Mycoplasmatota bacterium WC44]